MIGPQGDQNTDAEIRDGVWADSTKPKGADITAIDTLTEAGGAGDLAAIKTQVDAVLDLERDDGTVTVTDTETTIKEDASPGKVKEGVVVKIDMSAMQAGDTFVVREYYKVKSGGSYILADENTYSDAQSVPLKIVELSPYRYGMKVTAQRTAGSNRDMDWESYIGE